MEIYFSPFSTFMNPKIYYEKKVNGIFSSEIVLSKPILANLSFNDVQSTLCHEMIHAWVDMVLKVNEMHGPNFHIKMSEINASQNDFRVCIRHNYPVVRKELKYKGRCQNCGQIFLYRRRVKNIACKKCCNLLFEGIWNKKCLILFEN